VSFEVGDKVNVQTPYLFRPGTVVDIVEDDGTRFGEDTPHVRYYVKLSGGETYAFWEHQLETAVLDQLASVLDDIVDAIIASDRRDSAQLVLQ
jgi:hypothetical protein